MRNPVDGRFLPVPALDRFWPKVNRRGPDECWPWIGLVESNGYGRFSMSSRPVTAHRAAYELLVGPIPDGLHIDHLCHSDDPGCPGGVCAHRICVNPNHLEAVTPRENTMRGRTAPALNAAKTHCVRGHPFDETNTYLYSDGRRSCWICIRMWRLVQTERRRQRAAA